MFLSDILNEKKQSTPVFTKEPIISRLSHSFNDAHWSYPYHVHKQETELIYFSQGKASYQINNEIFHVSEGDLLIVNKPANMPIHPSLGNYENTLANGVSYYYAQKGEEFVYRCVNRLDRDTTGALILAKNALSAAILSAQMRNRQIRRTYLALVEGVPPEKGTISAPIARVEGSTIQREVNFYSGEPAVTHFERLSVRNGCSLMELHLETGRTHQIRVHMKYLGYPLPGDYLYHPHYERIQRQPLHSYQLEFTHPVTGTDMLFTAPVPEDFCRAYYISDVEDKGTQL